jgi:hypothetical protein
MLPPSSGLGIQCRKDGVREQRMRLCEQANGRRWCQEGTADIFCRKFRKNKFDKENISKKLPGIINQRG